jgi:uncharacterized protein (TIGR02145 family)
MKKIIALPFLFLCVFSAIAQSPQAIPYQAVLRNTDGSVIANQAVTITFTIHNNAVDGTTEYQENHSTTSNALGLINLNVGQGTPSVGTFSAINWGSGTKFLQVAMNNGNGNIDLGTQQMLSVPYALYSDNTHVSISTTGDTLTIGGQSVIVPGISASNPATNGGLGSQVLEGNTTCANEYISISDCGGQTSLSYDGHTYDLVEIGGQCWFADNLATDQYRNGDLIPTGLDNTTWQNTSTGAYAIYNNDPANDVTYGKLYNWYTTVDSRGLCPIGWHIPTDCEWMYLEGSVGMTVAQQQEVGINRNNNQGDLLKSTLGWAISNTGAIPTNSSGFSALPSGYYKPDNNSYLSILHNGFWWSTTSIDSLNAWTRNLFFNDSDIGRIQGLKNRGYSIRCIRD